MKTRIFYLTDLLSPYRVDWMNAMSDDFDIECYVFDLDEKTRTKDWLTYRKPNFSVNTVSSTYFAGIRFSKECTKILKNRNYDIYLIDGYASYAQVSAIKKLTKLRKNVFVNIDGVDIWKNGGFLSRIKNVVKKEIFRSGANFLCGSLVAKEYVLSLGAKKENVFLHHFTSLFKKDLVDFSYKKNAQNGCKKMINCHGKKMALAVGRFITIKRYDDLINAWTEMPKDWELYLIGGGRLYDWYSSLIREKGLTNVFLIDYIEPKELDKYYLAADLFVHTSETETWGLVLNEAMAKCCPCIATDRCVAGIELIKNGINGFIYNVGDVKTLSKRIQEVLRDEYLTDKMMENAAETIKCYTIENMAKTHIDIFREVLSHAMGQC